MLNLQEKTMAYNYYLTLQYLMDNAGLGKSYVCTAKPTSSRKDLTTL
jgi:hypothetical protein